MQVDVRGEPMVAKQDILPHTHMLLDNGNGSGWRRLTMTRSFAWPLESINLWVVASKMTQYALI
jgi:hypothetical protein